jgi:probable rRNA maturation factor
MNDKSKEHQSSIQAPPGAEIETDPGSSYLITVQIEEEFRARIDCDALHRLAMSVLKAESKPGPLELGVVVTTDDEVHALNREYLGHDYPTDVLSFGMEGEEQFITPQERAAYLGDVVVSYEQAAEQAPTNGHTAEQEVATPVIHGILHLLGYDDLDEHPERRCTPARTPSCVIPSSEGAMPPH